MSKLAVSVDHIEFTIDDRIVYVIQVQLDHERWQIRRRCSEFRHLRHDILHLMKHEKRAHQRAHAQRCQDYIRNVEKLAFPPRILFGNRKDRVVRERAVLLHQFLNSLLILTHQFRKDQRDSHSYTASLSSQVQASGKAFYRLRDFLKPIEDHSAPTLLQEVTGTLGSADSQKTTMSKMRMQRSVSVITDRYTRRDNNSQKSHTSNRIVNNRHNQSVPIAETLRDQPPGGQVELIQQVKSSKLVRIQSFIQSEVKQEKAAVATDQTSKLKNASKPSKDEYIKTSVQNTQPKMANNKQTSQSESIQRKSSRHKEALRSMDITLSQKSRVLAQNISVRAQRELEKALTEYDAIMILRYVDRFINKAVTKTPGCYWIGDNEHLHIDSERFLAEVEETFHALPTTFADLFKNRVGEWMFPDALDAYVQLKWNSFREWKSTPVVYEMSKASESEDGSESEYEYEQIGTGGFMRKKTIEFTQDEADVLQEMIACGTAGRDQEVRLQKQIIEQQWKRRERPKTDQNAASDDPDSDTDEEAERSNVKTYQQQMNAKRRSRLSRTIER
uniref:Uncharacterized protein AlNc14C54G4180 n=1 Tax=Albugo laibachii Nc14 TaxID=890382 RepID=F0WBZ3_9STRA|nr:conserved hypothetical protein [Albugo laibachii Nc14]|eukprot:CCA18674.1 conserved hypothetical protein [Albugo laibachii Nc14]